MGGHRGLEERLNDLLGLLRGEQEVILLGVWAQAVIHDAYRKLIASAVQSAAFQSAPTTFESLGLWQSVREGKKDPFGDIGPIHPHITAGDVETMIELLGARLGQQAAAQDLTRQPETRSLLETNGGVKPANKRERGPDLDTSRERLKLLQQLHLELTTIFQHRHKYNSVEELRTKYPDFGLWNLLPTAEQEELLTQDFKPKTYAAGLVLRRYGLTSRETLKKDRQKLRRFIPPKKSL